jgi:hypothetical protein
MNTIKTHWKSFTLAGVCLVLVMVLLISGVQIKPTVTYNYNNEGQPVFYVGNPGDWITFSQVEAGTTEPDFSGITSTVVQQAVNSLPTTGGVIQLISPAYAFTATVSRAINNVTIRGMNGTTISYNGTDPVFSAGSQTGWKFEDLITDAGGITQAADTMLVHVKINTTSYGVSASSLVTDNLDAASVVTDRNPARVASKDDSIIDSFTSSAYAKSLNNVSGDVLFKEDFKSWESSVIMETSTILDDNGIYHRWYRSGEAGAEAVGYAESTDGITFTRYSGNPLTLTALKGNVFPSVFEYNSRYYMIVAQSPGYDSYLYDVTDPIHPVIMNGGTKVLTGMFNTSVVAVGSTLYMLAEASGGGLKYSYSDMATMNWDTHLSAEVIATGGNPCLIYIPASNALLSIQGMLVGGPLWHIKASYASLTDDLSLSASWHASTALDITTAGVHICDPDVFLSSTGTVVIAGTYKQAPTYQWNSTLTLAQFYTNVVANTSITMTADASNPTMNTEKESRWTGYAYSTVVNDGDIISSSTSGYVSKKADTAPIPFYETVATFSDTTGYIYQVDAKVVNSATTRIEFVIRLIDANNYVKIMCYPGSSGDGYMGLKYQECVAGTYGSQFYIGPVNQSIWPNDGAYHTIKVIVIGSNNIVYLDGVFMGQYTTTTAAFLGKDMKIGIQGGSTTLAYYTNILVTSYKPPKVINYVEHFQDVLAASATGIRSNEDLSAAVPITFTLDAQPDVPRTLSGHFDAHAQITAYTIVITGVDARGITRIETFTQAASPWDFVTTNAYATITSIIMTARTGTGAGDTMDIGTGSKIGLSNPIQAVGDLYKVKQNNANLVLTKAVAEATYHTVDFGAGGGSIGAADDLTVWYKSNFNIGN